MTDNDPSLLERRRFLKSTAVAGSAGLFAGCTTDDEPPVDPDDDDGDDTTGGSDDTGDDDPAPDDEFGGEFVFATPEDVETLDPRMNTLLWYGNAAHYMFDSLLLMEPDGEGTVPHLAAELPEEVDETTYVVELREGVEFHNGEEMTAEDVAYSLNWVLDPDNNSPNAANLEWLGEAEATGTYEVTLHLDYQFALMNQALASMNSAIVPRSVGEELDEEWDGDADQIGDWQEPIGTGPFQFDENVGASHLRMTSFDDYFLGEPRLDSVEYRIIPENEVAFVELSTGEIHQAGISQELLGQAEQESDIETSQFSSFNYRGMILNCLEEPFDDVRVREAMQYLVDYDDMLAAAVDQLGSRNWGYVPDEVADAWDFPRDEWQQYYPDQDHDRALELLEEAGVGTDFEPEIVALSGESWMGMSIVLQNEFEQIGVDASIQEVEIGEWLDALDYGEYDICTYGWGGGDDPDGYYYYMFRDLANDEGGMSDDIAGHSSAGYIHEAYRDDPDVNEDLQRVDELVRDARTYLDRDERRDRYVEAGELLHELNPVIPVYSSDSSTGWHTTVQDYEPAPFGDQELFHHWQNAWIDE